MQRVITIHGHVSLRCLNSSPRPPLDSTASISVKLTWRLKRSNILADYLKYPCRYFKLLPCPSLGGFGVVAPQAPKKTSTPRWPSPTRVRSSVVLSHRIQERYSWFRIRPWETPEDLPARSPLHGFLFFVSSAMSLAQERLRSWRFPSDWMQMNADCREKSHLRGLFFFESPREPRKNEMPSAVDWAASPVAALLIWPDLVTCTMQIDPEKCKNISSWFTVLLNEQGFSGFFKFGFYEFFKKLYVELAGPEHASKYKTFIYLVGSASAEIIANVALFPMEAMKIRIQTQPGFAKGLRDGLRT